MYLSKSSFEMENNMKRFLSILLALLLLCGCSSADPETTASSTATGSVSVGGDVLDAPVGLGQELLITDILAYTGAYMEDGSDDVVSDVLGIILKNNSRQALQYADITLSFGQEQAQFSAVNIPAGQRVVLLEKSRMAYTGGLPDSTQLSNVVFLPELPMHADVFAVTGSKGMLTVKNISDTAITGDIYIYYKNKSQDLLYGGISYRVKLRGLEAGESETVIAAHFRPGASEVLMVSYIQ